MLIMDNHLQHDMRSVKVYLPVLELPPLKPTSFMANKTSLAVVKFFK